MKSSNIKEKLSSLPQLPGSYIFKDVSGKVIYVGKAKNLKSRIRSYFNIKIDKSFKTAELVKRINDIDFIIVESEFEALILEAELIKKYKPKYNIILKDDRSNLYIVIRNDKFNISGKNTIVPKIITARKLGILEKDVVFGPYPSYQVAKNILNTVRKIIPFRDCSYEKFSRYKKIGSSCLYGHINLCFSPCTNNSIKDIQQYKRNINKVKNILSGNVSKILTDVQKDMKYYAKRDNFEEAARCRDLLNKFSYVQNHFREASEYIDNPYLIEDMNKKSLEDIKEFIPILNKIPKRIECYDISNISGKEAVGSMVVAIDGKIDKSEYKRFKVRLNKDKDISKIKQDDSGMLYEVLFRRLKRESVVLNRHENVKRSNVKKWGKPDLIIVDGGKPQVFAAMKVMEDLNVHVPVIGVAKKYEKLVYKEKGGVYIEELKAKDSYGMKLIINLRDESHRFAQSYHHLLRKNSLLR